MRKVKEPNINPPDNVTIPRQIRTVCQLEDIIDSSLFPSLKLLLVGASSNSLNAKICDSPNKKHNIAGTINANLQSAYAIRKPVKMGAKATPIFPQTPLIPNLKPTFPGLLINIAIPTG